MDESKKRKDPGFPMPPSSRTGDNQQTKDLMSRLQAFLPEMKAANQALSSEPVGLVDVELKKGNSDDDDDSDSDDDDSSNASGDQIKQLDRKNPLISESKGEGENDDEGGTVSAPMIQIQFALTDPNNPLVDLFANDDEKNGEESENCRDDEDDQQEGPSKTRAVRSMLKSTSSTKKEEPPKIRLLRSDNPTPKKSLITELS
ncbi:unnamed protein product [Cylindrotheca closterium]|uniref:Uncharacterized protein n=1 Tax=Cylindrotheca closterium TaxID=2856 RepID=A0AAD2CSK2_9STRA|nr:unnamed protein product [Cylindrotheca closterium]